MGENIRPAIRKKMEQVEELKKAIEEHKGEAVVILDLRNTPNQLLQKTRKRLKEGKKAFFKVYKLTVLKRALEGEGLPEGLYSDITFPSAVILVAEHPYRLSLDFRANMLSVPAKPGQIAEEDIVVEAGETDLPPGPVLSELKAAGLPVKIEKGKIAVIKDTVLVKKGEVIDEMKAKALQTLGIKPFKVGVKVYKAFYEGLLFTPEVLSLTPEAVEEGISSAIGYAINLGLNANYVTPENAELLIVKAFQQAKGLAFEAAVPSKAFIEELLSLAYRQANALPSEGGKNS